MPLEELFEECTTFLETNIDPYIFFFNVFKKKPTDDFVNINKLYYFLEVFEIDLEDAKRIIMPNMGDKMKQNQGCDLKIFTKLLQYYEIDLKHYFESKNNEENGLLRSNPIYFISAYWNDIRVGINKK